MDNEYLDNDYLHIETQVTVKIKTKKKRNKSYPIHNGRPALHCDALKYRQHGKADIIEIGDPGIRALPFL